MQTFRLSQYLFVVSFIAILSACDVGGAPNMPADQSPNTSTPSNSNQSPASKTGAGVSSQNAAVLRAALNHTKDTPLYRMSLDFKTGATVNNQFKEQTFLKFDGELNGAANHVIYSGGIFNEMLGGGERIEIITLDGKTYLKGSSLFGTADPNKWYFLVDSAISKPPFDLNDMLLQTGDDADKGKVIGNESVDGQACETWLTDFTNEAGALIDIVSTDDTRNDFNTLDSAEARFVRCPDNFVHKLTWSVQAHDSQNANQKGSVSVTIHLFDFNANNIKIAAPTDAIELR